MSLNDFKKVNFQNFLVLGIFVVLLVNCICVDLNLMLMIRCKCEGFDNYNLVEDNFDSYKWLVEFVFGILNDVIQK